MSRFPLAFLASLPLVGALLFAARPVPPRPGAPAGRVPVVVELFTSEGCSSCPAADAALRELETTQPVAGAEIIALGQHVDYWNRLGWHDPFSAPQFTERQRGYARAFNINSYTPQAVVNGRAELVGSQRSRLLEAVAQAARQPRATVALAAAGPGQLTVRVRDLPAGTGAATVLLALTETGLASQVGRGENDGRQLRHAAVVRALRPLGPVGADGQFAATVPLRLDAGWQRGHLRAVVLVQAAATQHIVGVADLPLGAATE
ncbi:DUF1223 domain-containing protein [Hymenobacter jeollabukensis]|uniref:DUF1223 domain-containing protein n=1 Tax=Hymenobacter jeollabukensis TaxID=2025313 RepID=A0A5R8WT82_9BACT|nr:DUF1223 domain-containing protein [Hymenobacter jeollabukensis]TLM94017.1 DUF1223 domain-containing protein [Hymenobacter jeollabukensis]